MKVTLRIEKRAVYGQVLYYIADKEYADFVRSLTGKKTVSDSDIDALRSLGLIIEWI